MGSLSITCPMCCQEKFADTESLKYHLLSMIENLYCPKCSTRVYSIAALIQHLECCGKESEQEDIKNDIVSAVEESVELMNMDNNDDDDNDDDHRNDILMAATSDENFLATVNEEGVVLVTKGRTIQVDENGDIRVVEKSSPIKTESPEKKLLKSPSPMKEKSKNVTNTTKSESNEEVADCEQIEYLDYDSLKDKQEEESVALYNCSTCDMSFTSVYAHIEEFHAGEKVVLDIGADQIDEVNKQGNVNDKSRKKNTSTKKSKNIASASYKQRDKMKTVETEDCVDSKGRLFTRKIVKIDNFSDRKPVTLSATKAPMIEKFFSNVEGVKVKDKSVTVAPTKMYRCNQCLDQFPKLLDYRVHVCPQGTNHCDQCDLTFATNKALQNHMKSHDITDATTQKIFICRICGTQFLSHKSLRLHSRMHQPVKARHVDAPEGTEEDTFECEECGATLSEAYREAHMGLHAGNTITCSICNRKFDSRESLNMHAAVHNEVSTVNITKEVTLTPLLTNTTETTSLTNNIEPTDPIAEDAVVPEFVSAGVTPESSAGSKVTDTDLQDALTKPYQCQHCGRRFTRPHEKVKHERIHTGEKPHSCEVCGKKFRVSYCLTLHMRTHTGVRPYECKHCGKRFKASSVYNHHLLTHGDARAYTCPFCPKTFKTRVQLAGHKNSHTKPFRCTECSRPFASLYAARAHMQTHKKDNNLKFSCVICGASYGRAFALKDHMKQHEPELNENVLVPPEAEREEEVQEMEDFLQNDGIVDEKIIIPESLNMEVTEEEEEEVL